MLECANEDGAFGNESAKAREAKPCETGKHKANAEERHLAHDTAHFRDVAGVGAFVNHTDSREEKPSQESVRNHLEARATKSNRCEGCKSEEDEAQVADGAVSGDVFEVFVADGDERAKYHVKDEECYNVREPNLGGFGHEEHGNAEASVGTHFHHHAGGEHRNSGRCSGVTVRAPEVEREKRTRNGESHEHERECPHLEIHRESRLCNFNEVPACGATFEVKSEERCKNHRRAKCECQRELFTTVVALAAAVAGNHEVHAKCFHFVEHEEKHQVKAHVHAVNACCQKLDKRKENLLISFDVEAYEHACPDDKRRECKQQHVETVRADNVVGIEHRKPRDVREESECKRCGCRIRRSSREGVYGVSQVADNCKDNRCRSHMDRAKRLSV